MSIAGTEISESGSIPSTADRIADAVRHVTHVPHQARLVTSMARDAGEEGVHAARRAIRRVQRRIDALEDLKDQAAHSVRRHPFKAVGVAFGIGLQIGSLMAWFGHRGRQRHDTLLREHTATL